MHSTEHFKKEKQDLNKIRMKLHKYLTHLNLGYIKKGQELMKVVKRSGMFQHTHNTIKLSHWLNLMLQFGNTLVNINISTLFEENDFMVI